MTAVWLVFPYSGPGCAQNAGITVCETSGEVIGLLVPQGMATVDLELIRVLEIQPLGDNGSRPRSCCPGMPTDSVDNRVSGTANNLSEAGNGAGWRDLAKV